MNVFFAEQKSELYNLQRVLYLYSLVNVYRYIYTLKMYLLKVSKFRIVFLVSSISSKKREKTNRPEVPLY